MISVDKPRHHSVGDVVQVFAVAVAWTLSTQPEASPPAPLPPHLEEIVTGSHPSLGVDGRASLTVMSSRPRVIRSLVALKWSSMRS